MSYNECLRDAMSIHNVSTPDERSAHLARSMLKMKNKYIHHANKKKDRSVVIITEPPKHIVEQKHTTNICQSTTLKGKRCSFKATNGCFCKKHSTAKDSVVLGNKI
jgi:hypothetical protein